MESKDLLSQLPRGLISRSGSQRLPSLRSDSHSTQSLIASNMTSNQLPSTTRGGAVKRTFRPTIPTRRNVSEDNHKQNQNNDKSNQNRRPKPRNNLHNNRGKDSKNWVQTEGAVFRGEQNTQLSRQREDSSSRKRSSLSNDVYIKSELKSEKSDEKTPKVKIESKAKLIRRLYGDNFIDDDDQQGMDCRMEYPKGWQTVSTHRQPIVSQSAEPLTPYNLLKTDSQEKVLLMQIPEEVIRRSDGYIGKIRVYKSGRIELHDSESDIKFDIIFAKNSSFDSNVKQENDNKSKPMTNTCEDITEDVVYFKGNELCTLASVEHKQVLLAVPSIPLEDQIIPQITL